MSTRQEAEHAAAEWLARRESPSWSEADADALETWLSADMTHKVAYFRFNATWKEVGRLKAVCSGPMPERRLADVVCALDPSQPSAARLQSEEARGAFVGRHRRWLTVAAAMALIAIGADFAVRQVPSLFRHHVYSTAVGGLAAVPIPDGSRVTLNTDSEVRVAVSKSERRIDLQRGEAFFEVATDPTRPFIVVAGSQRIVAVGTAFSVRRDGGDDVQVRVAEGAVRVEPLVDGRKGESALLRAGSKAQSKAGSIMVQNESVPAIEQDLSWRSGSLSFHDTPLADAVAEFNRYNSRKIVIDDPSIAEIQIGGVYRATNVDAFIELIVDGFSIEAVRSQDAVRLRGRP